MKKPTWAFSFYDVKRGNEDAEKIKKFAKQNRILFSK